MAPRYAAEVDISPHDMQRRVAALRHRAIALTEKGFCSIAAQRTVTAAALTAQRPSLFGAEFTMPLLVLRDSALTHNVTAMADWCTAAGLLHAPHGKTTMAPQLFERQLAAGAWGITAATISQVQVYRSFGFSRILLANELTDPAGISWLAAELSAEQDWECVGYVDSVAGVELLASGLSAAGATRPLPVLVELGFPGGRTGCRSVTQAQAVAVAVDQASSLRLAGAAGYEGGIGSDGEPETLVAVSAYCRQLRELAQSIGGGLVSAGGSAYFDVVARELSGLAGQSVVLRSGCYLTHDHGEYATNSPAARHTGPELRPAIELWAPVLSCPEPGLALACAGRRDVAFDQGLPIPLRIRRPDGAFEPAERLTVTRLDDQHAYLSVPAGLQLEPGDLIGFGISHPCTTFDKWRVIPVVDDDYRVIDAVHTFF